MEEETKYITLAEVKEILEEENESRGELNHEQGFALQHARATARLPGKRARALVEKLMEVEGINEMYAVNLVDVLPTHPDDVTAVFYKERFDLPEDTIKKILEIFEENL